jgi:hypothetical protein
MKFNVLLVILLSISFNSIAEEKITSAFGLSLGDKFDINSSIGESALTDGTPLYLFEANKKFRSFANHYVMLTPKTHKVYAIWGIGQIENTPSCKKEQALVMAILQKKYGKPEKGGLTASFRDIKSIDQGNRSVLTKCSGYSDVTIEVRYTDKKLKDAAENERIIIESEKLDSSAL